MKQILLPAKRILCFVMCLAILTGNVGPTALAAEEGPFLQPLAGVVSQITITQGHVAVLRCDGTVAAVGDDSLGQCRVSDWSRVVKIWAEQGITVGLTKEGDVLCTACDLSAWKDITDIYVAACHFGLGSNSVREMLIAGWRRDGTAEIMAVTSQGTLKFTQQWRDVVQVLGSNNCVYGLKKDGTVLRAGVYAYAPDFTDVTQWTGVSRIAAGKGSIFGITEDGRVLSEDPYIDTKNWRNVKKLVPGFLNSVYGITYDGKVYEAGEILLGSTPISGVTELAAASVTKVGVRSDGSVVFSPEPDISKAERERWRDVKKLVYIPGYEEIVILRTDGEVVGAFIEGYQYPAPCDGWTDIVDICRGGYDFLGLKTDGTLVTTGKWDLTPLTENVA